jgi:N-acetylmuramoyl-L-alanine amidase
VTPQTVDGLSFLWIPAVCFRAGRSKPLKGIVLHSSDGHRDGDVATLTGEDSGVSSHWYVSKSGAIYHFVQDSDTAYHAGIAKPGWTNAETIGIETEHVDHEEDWSPALVDSVKTLVAWLRKHHGLPLPVARHADIALPPGRKEDPVGFPGIESL